MLALEVLKNYVGEFDVFSFPLGFGKDDPMQRTLGAFFEDVREKWLGVPHKSDFPGGEAQLFPDQTHQPVAIGAAACIAVAAGCQDQADVLQISSVRRDGVRGLIRQTLDQQRMRRIKVVMMESDMRVGAPGLTDGISESFALQEIEIEGCRQQENLGRAVPGRLRDRLAQGVDRS